ncbi:MAG: hypothetical protein OXC44_01130 [Proteobacteria bacterium]|nr:hypothetical protein [Pseudomonadota bacterium]
MLCTPPHNNPTENNETSHLSVMGVFSKERLLFRVILEEICLIPLPGTQQSLKAALDHYLTLTWKQLAHSSGLQEKELRYSIKRYRQWHQCSKKSLDELKALAMANAFAIDPSSIKQRILVKEGKTEQLINNNHKNVASYVRKELGQWLSHSRLYPSPKDQQEFWLYLESQKTALSAALFLRKEGYTAYYVYV